MTFNSEELSIIHRASHIPNKAMKPFDTSYSIKNWRNRLKQQEKVPKEVEKSLFPKTNVKINCNSKISSSKRPNYFWS
jgi:hypothetical protein